MKNCLLMLTMLIPLQAYAQTSYLCIADAITGFSYDKNLKKWLRTTFDSDKDKHLLKKTKKGWEWSDFGSSTGMQCGEFNEYGYLNCDLFFGSLRFNKNALRYIATYEAGYIDGVDDKSDTPYISIGKCSPL